jgi:hypothetical protein
MENDNNEVKDFTFGGKRFGLRARDVGVDDKVTFASE